MATLLASASRTSDEGPGISMAAAASSRHCRRHADGGAVLHHRRQVLVRLDNAKTYLLHVPASTSALLLPRQILATLSAATSIPACHLRIATPPESPVWADATPYVSASFHLPLLGGKGGFGTLLKGQSKQAGAKTTLDFGACRDLSGRRLRHVNDEVKLRKWRDAQSRRDRGLPVDEVGELRTESGIRNWHLMVPGWADGAASSNKARRKADLGLKREVQRWQTAEEREKQRREEAKQRQEMAVTDYVRAGEAAAAAAALETTSKKDKVLEIMMQQKKEKNRKRGRDDGEDNGSEEGSDDAPRSKRAFGDDFPSVALASSDDEAGSYLCTLSGDVVVDDVADTKGDKMTRGKILLQSESEFATTAVLLSRPLPADAKGLYYEVTVRTGGLAQIGWAYAGSGSAGRGTKFDASTDLTSLRMFRPNSDTGDGVGDDDASFGYDGYRGVAFHAGEEKAASTAAEGLSSTSWKDGDVVGCFYNVAEGIVSYSLNGKDVGVAFKVEGESKTDDDSNSATGRAVLFPAASLNQGEMVQLNVGPNFSFVPTIESGQVGVCELIDTAEQNNDNDNDGDDGEDNVEEKKMAAATPSVQATALSAPKGSSTFGAITPGIMLPPVAEHGKSDAPAPPDNKVGDREPTGPCGKDDEKDDNDHPPFDLEKCASLAEAKELGMDRLKEILTSMGCKCGGSLDERAARLFSLKGLKREEIPKKFRGKNFVI